MSSAQCGGVGRRVAHNWLDMASLERFQKQEGGWALKFIGPCGKRNASQPFLCGIYAYMAYSTYNPSESAGKVCDTLQRHLKQGLTEALSWEPLRRSEAWEQV